MLRARLLECFEAQVTLECPAEIHHTLAPHDAQTLLNLGACLRLGDSLALFAALGRDVGVRSDDRQDLSFSRARRSCVERRLTEGAMRLQ